MKTSKSKKYVTFIDEEKAILNGLYSELFPFKINFDSLFETNGIYAIRDRSEFITLTSKNEKSIVVPILDYDDSDINKKAIAFSVLLKKRTLDIKSYVACISKRDSIYKAIEEDIRDNRDSKIDSRLKEIIATKGFYVPSLVLVYKEKLYGATTIDFAGLDKDSLEKTISLIIEEWQLGIAQKYR